MKSLSKLALTLILLLGVGLSAGTAADKPKRGGTLVFGISKDMVLMNPLVGSSSTERRIRELMFETLVGRDVNGKVHPHLAESWEVSKDGKTYTVNLRQGVKFHDGRALTAHDVAFSIGYTQNPKNGATGLKALRVLERVEVVGPHRLRLVLKRVSPTFIYSLADAKAFTVVPKDSLPEGVRRTSNFPPGSGPFKFGEWQPKQRIVFERNDDYWGQKAHVDRVVLRPISDDTVRLTALQAGDIDMTERVPYEWVRQIVEGKLRGIHYVEASNAGSTRLEFNTLDPPFNDKKLRLAVAHAVDRNEVIQAAYFGLGAASAQRYPKGHNWYFEGAPSYPLDLAKAKQLVKEAGYKGEPIELIFNIGEAEAEATVIQAQLKRIGLNVRLSSQERGANLARRRAGDFHFKMGGGSIDPDPWRALVDDFRCENDPKKRIENETGYCNRELEALLRRAETEVDEAKRRDLIRQAAFIVLADVPEVRIGFVPRFFALRDYVKGFTSDNTNAFQLWGGGLSRTWLDK